MLAVDVHNHMLERSTEHDIFMVTLMWLHFAAIADMIRDSEKEKDPELYRAGAQLALLLYAKPIQQNMSVLASRSGFF